MAALSPKDRFGPHNLASLLVLTYPEFSNSHTEWPPAVNIIRSRLKTLHADVDTSYFSSNRNFWHNRACAVRDVLRQAPYRPCDRDAACKAYEPEAEVTKAPCLEDKHLGPSQIIESSQAIAASQPTATQNQSRAAPEAAGLEGSATAASSLATWLRADRTRASAPCESFVR